MKELQGKGLEVGFSSSVVEWKQKFGRISVNGIYVWGNVSNSGISEINDGIRVTRRVMRETMKDSGTISYVRETV